MRVIADAVFNTHRCKAVKRIFLAMLLLLSILASGSKAHAEHVHSPVGITITCSCDDATGKAYVAAVHTLLAQDAHYREMGMEEGIRKNAIRINIVSMALEPVDGKPRAALSIVCMHDGSLVHQFVETCTHIPIADCARSMVSGLSQIVD